MAEGFSRSYTDPEKGPATEFAAAACTDLYRFVVSKNESGQYDLRFDNVCTVEGAAGDPHCLDRYADQLRCAVIRDERRRTDYDSGLHVIDTETSCDMLLLLDSSLTVASEVCDLADGNADGWIGYLGDRAVVTEQERGSSLILLDGSSDANVKQLSQTVLAQSIRSLGDQGYTAFYRSEAGKLTLTVYDEEMEPLSERSFGSDHSSTLENQAGYFSDGEAGVIAFSADDSYCVYGWSEEKGLYLRGDIYMDDWAWNARGFYLDEVLYVANTQELLLYELKDFTCLKHIRF